MRANGPSWAPYIARRRRHPRLIDPASFLVGVGVGAGIALLALALVGIRLAAGLTS